MVGKAVLKHDFARGRKSQRLTPIRTRGVAFHNIPIPHDLPESASGPSPPAWSPSICPPPPATSPFPPLLWRTYGPFAPPLAEGDTWRRRAVPRSFRAESFGSPRAVLRIA